MVGRAKSISSKKRERSSFQYEALKEAVSLYMTYFPLPPTRKSVLLDEEPQNERERAYQEALAAAYAREDQYRRERVRMQATIVLQRMYIDWATKELANNEEKRKKEKKVVEHNKSTTEQEDAREMLSAWRKEEAARRERNKTRRKAYQHELQLWKDEKTQGQSENRRPRWTKPTRGKLERSIPRPVVSTGAKVDEVEENVDQDDTEDDAESSDVIVISTDLQ